MVSTGNGNGDHGKELNFKPRRRTKQKVFNEKCTESLMRPSQILVYICMPNFDSVYLPESQMKTLEKARFNIKII